MDANTTQPTQPINPLYDTRQWYCTSCKYILSAQHLSKTLPGTHPVFIQTGDGIRKLFCGPLTLVEGDQNNGKGSAD